MMHDDGPLQDSQERWQEVAVLCSVAVAASIEEIAAALQAGNPGLTRNEVIRRVAELERRELLRTSNTPGMAPWQLTDRGRRLVLEHIGAWTTAAAELGTERHQVERLRTDLLATISHELRTPLTLIRTSIGLLLDSEPDEAMRYRLLRNIQSSADRMHALVTDLLDLARLRGHRLDLQIRRVDLGELVSGAISLIHPLLEAKEQHVELAIPSPAPAVPGDYRRLERVVLNLLGNANKFAPLGSEIAVTVSEDARQAVVAVRDTGPGITVEAMPHLFDQFFTERTSSSRHNIGSGLGLPIAKGIVEAHGGRIWVESDVGAGTTVWFTLPKIAAGERSDESPRGR